jgi:hypothetical protein
MLSKRAAALFGKDNQQSEQQNYATQQPIQI